MNYKSNTKARCILQDRLICAALLSNQVPKLICIHSFLDNFFHTVINIKGLEHIFIIDDMSIMKFKLL